MLLVETVTRFSNILFLTIVVGIPLFAALRGVEVFVVFVEGAKDGLTTVFAIIPFLVGMLVAIGMLRASGAFDLLTGCLHPILKYIGMPAGLVPMALLRPFSGSASNALLVDIIQHYGANSLIAKMAATMMGSTETTFYVIAIYFGVLNIKRTRYAIPLGLLADLTGILASVWICRIVFSHS